MTHPADGETWTEALQRHSFLYTFHPIERFPALLRARADHFHAAQGKSAAIADLKRWLMDTNLADGALSMMVDQAVDQAVDLVRDVADRIDRETASGAPGATRKSRAPRKARR